LSESLRVTGIQKDGRTDTAPIVKSRSSITERDKTALWCSILTMKRGGAKAGLHRVNTQCMQRRRRQMSLNASAPSIDIPPTTNNEFFTY